MASNYIGEILSLAVAASWTVTALFADKATHRIGADSSNVIRLALALCFLAVILWVSIGSPYPVYADGSTLIWLAASALVGYLFGDTCLFNCYLYIGARFGQLFMTLAPPMAAIAAWIIMGEKLSWTSWIAMFVTLSGITISILGRNGGSHKIGLTLPWQGVLLGLGAGLGQGVGLVLSKVGMQHYEAALPSDAPDNMGLMLPFASTMVRALIGGLGFFIIMALRRDLPKLKAAVHDGKAMKYALFMTLFGPVFGVSMSLMAVRFTDAGIASTLMALTPVMILFPYAFIYKQKISFRELCGVLLSVLGVALFFLL